MSQSVQRFTAGRVRFDSDHPSTKAREDIGVFSNVGADVKDEIAAMDKGRVKISHLTAEKPLLTIENMLVSRS
jgi:hypothetical protein